MSLGDVIMLLKAEKDLTGLEYYWVKELCPISLCNVLFFFFYIVVNSKFVKYGIILLEIQSNYRKLPIFLLKILGHNFQILFKVIKL